MYHHSFFVPTIATGIPKYVKDYKDLIASPDVDAVLICSPTDQVWLRKLAFLFPAVTAPQLTNNI